MPTLANQPTLESTQVVGAILWDQFARERLAEAGVDSIESNVSLPHGIADEEERTPIDVRLYGRELRRIAEQFEKTRLRVDVKQRANQVSVSKCTRIYKQSYIDSYLIATCRILG